MSFCIQILIRHEQDLLRSNSLCLGRSEPAHELRKLPCKAGYIKMQAVRCCALLQSHMPGAALEATQTAVWRVRAVR
jgi:hypothetical protein